MSDADLLASYVREGSEAAFAALVTRYLDLVYSVARRHVQSSAAAQDVAQSVFLDLARQAPRIRVAPDEPLVAWLHLVSRRTALNAARDEARRAAREREATQAAAFMKNPPPDWSAVEPLLDEAVGSLGEADRAAILLRYLAGKSLREVGESLGVSEDTAQKRVSRALDRLRTFFVRRGVAVTATGLASDLSAHALQLAPAGWSTTISGAVLAAGAGAPAAALATKTLAMTATAKTLLAATLVAVAGVGIYEATLVARRGAEIDTLRQHTAELAATLRQAQAEQSAAAAALKSVEHEIDLRLPAPAPALSAADEAIARQARTWFANLDRLKRTLADRPNLAIPDLRQLSETRWLEASARDPIESEEALRQALADLRHVAQNITVAKISRALTDYMRAHDGTLPPAVADLVPFFDSPIDPALLAGYEMLQSGKESALPPNERMSLLANTGNIVDAEYDTFWRIGVGGYTTSSALQYEVIEARKAFSAAHDGQKPASNAQLLPYLKWPVSAERLNAMFLPRPANAPGH